MPCRWWGGILLVLIPAVPCLSAPVAVPDASPVIRWFAVDQDDTREARAELRRNLEARGWNLSQTIPLTVREDMVFRTLPVLVLNPLSVSAEKSSSAANEPVPRLMLNMYYQANQIASLSRSGAGIVDALRGAKYDWDAKTLVLPELTLTSAEISANQEEVNTWVLRSLANGTRAVGDLDDFSMIAVFVDPRNEKVAAQTVANGSDALALFGLNLGQRVVNPETWMASGVAGISFAWKACRKILRTER